MEFKTVANMDFLPNILYKVAKNHVISVDGLPIFRHETNLAKSYEKSSMLLSTFKWEGEISWWENGSRSGGFLLPPIPHEMFGQNEWW